MFSVPEGVKTEVTPGGVRRADGVVTTPGPGSRFYVAATSLEFLRPTCRGYKLKYKPWRKPQSESQPHAQP